MRAHVCSRSIACKPAPRQVGVDTKAVQEAWTGIAKKHGDKLAALFVSVDADKGRALALAGGARPRATAARRACMCTLRALPCRPVL